MRSWPSREPKHRRNGKIRAREVRVLDEHKAQIGVMTLNEALKLAMAKGLDLVEIAPNATPPVCRIVDYGKLMYEEAKGQKESKSPANKLKELQLTAGIDPHDFGVKLQHAIQFLCAEHKVRIKLRFRGRQRAHKDLGYDLIHRFLKEAAPWGSPDAQPKMLGDRDLNVILSPLPKTKRAANPKAEPLPPPPPKSGPAAATAAADAPVAPDSPAT